MAPRKQKIKADVPAVDAPAKAEGSVKGPRKAKATTAPAQSAVAGVLETIKLGMASDAYPLDAVVDAQWNVFSKNDATKAEYLEGLKALGVDSSRLTQEAAPSTVQTTDAVTSADGSLPAVAPEQQAVAADAQVAGEADAVTPVEADQYSYGDGMGAPPAFSIQDLLANLQAMGSEAQAGQSANAGVPTPSTAAQTVQAIQGNAATNSPANSALLAGLTSTQAVPPAATNASTLSGLTAPAMNMSALASQSGVAGPPPTSMDMSKLAGSAGYVAPQVTPSAMDTSKLTGYSAARPSQSESMIRQMSKGTVPPAAPKESIYSRFGMNPPSKSKFGIGGLYRNAPEAASVGLGLTGIGVVGGGIGYGLVKAAQALGYGQEEGDDDAAVDAMIRDGLGLGQPPQQPLMPNR